MKKIIFLLTVIFFFAHYNFILTDNMNLSSLYKNTKEIYIYDKNHKSEYIKNLLQSNNIQCKYINSCDKNSDSLFLIFDAYELPLGSFPKNYIIYQTADLEKVKLTQDYVNKLSKSVAIWDYSWNNINKYNTAIFNYYYFPENYEFADPVILSCLLPTNTLNNYKEMLIYSNKVNTDISSHLPTIFAHSVLQNPDILIELGIRGGESTKAFSKALQFCKHTKLIGLDVDNTAGNAYNNLKNALFVCMNDVDFPKYWKNNTELNKRSIDIIFIDTSHLYEHTFAEISAFAPLLSQRGFLLFHDSHMSPLINYTYTRINNIMGSGGWDNGKGVIRAIKDYFSIKFEETKYAHFGFIKDEKSWEIIHYPFCNGLTLIKKN